MSAPSTAARGGRPTTEGVREPGSHEVRYYLGPRDVARLDALVAQLGGTRNSRSKRALLDLLDRLDAQQ